MLRKILFMGLIFLTVSCESNTIQMCPFITIPRETAYVTQKVNYSDEFQVEMIGFEGYCEQVYKDKRHLAVVTPIFRVQRLRDSDETAVDVGFYAQAVKGPPQFLGRKSYSASTNIERNVMQKRFNGQPIKIRIPNDNAENFEILMGMDISEPEYNYNQRTFDIKYQYDYGDEEEVVPAPAPVPAATPAPAKKSGCDSCGI